MLNILGYIAVALLSYLCGAVPYGLLIGKCYGVDIRTVGSKNTGATNVTRCVGKWQGKLCFLCDFLKGMLPVLAVMRLYRPAPPLLVVIAGFCAVLGHVLPVFLKFKGGKGVSTAAGVAFALSPYPLLAAGAVWVAVYFASRYVSLASIIAAVSLPIFTVIFRGFGIGTPVAQSGIVLGLFIVIAVLAVWRHRSNIKRLIDGTESSFRK